MRRQEYRTQTYCHDPKQKLDRKPVLGNNDILFLGATQPGRPLFAPFCQRVPTPELHAGARESRLEQEMEQQARRARPIASGEPQHRPQRPWQGFHLLDHDRFESDARRNDEQPNTAQGDGTGLQARRAGSICRTAPLMRRTFSNPWQVHP